MKLKLFTLTAILFSLLVTMSCSSKDDDPATAPTDTIELSDLPERAQTFLRSSLDLESIDMIMRSAEGYDVSVKGYKIDFDKNGEWKKIKSKDDGALPDHVLSLIPIPITGYIGALHPDRRIVEIKKKDFGYRIELTGKPDIELEFDHSGNIIREDQDDDDDDNVSIDMLPDLAKTFIKTHFSGLQVEKAEKDNKIYEVKFKDETELEFDLSGNWIKVETEKNKTIPASVINLLPNHIVEYIAIHYPLNIIYSIEDKNTEYELKLYDGIELSFDKDGNGIDDGDEDDDDPEKIDYSKLPLATQDFLNAHFSGIGILYVNRAGNEFKVGLVDGTRMDFLLSGEVQTIVAVRSGGIPDGAMMPAIQNYVARKYPNKKVMIYIKQYKGYMLQLSGYPVSKVFFDLDGNFLRAY